MTGFPSKCLPPTITRCHRVMETDQSGVGREVTQHNASASNTDFTSNNPGVLSEKDNSPEAIVAKLFGKSESDLALIKNSMRIAENVVLGPSTSAHAIGTSTAAVVDHTDTHSSGEAPLVRKFLGNPNDYMNNASALANKLMMQTNVNLHEKDNRDTTQALKGTCLNDGRETHSKKPESEDQSILSVLSSMAAEAGMEDVNTVGSSHSPVPQPILTSPRSSFPEICNDYVPVASNISFDYSIDSLINNESNASKDNENNSAVGRERVSHSSSPTANQESDHSRRSVGSAEESQPVSSVASSYPQDLSRSNVDSNTPSTVTQVTHTVSSRAQCDRSASLGQTISTTSPATQSPSFQQRHRSPPQVSQPVDNSSVRMHGASISSAPSCKVPEQSAYQMPELNLPDLRELDSFSSIFPEPHIQQPHMMAWNNFNVTQPATSPMRTHHGLTAPSVALPQHSPVMQSTPSPTLSHHGPFTQPLQSPTLPHQGIARPVASPALSPHKAPHGSMMAPPQMQQHNVNRMTMVQDHMNARQLNTGMSFTHSQQTALPNSMSTTQNPYFGNTAQPNQMSGYNAPREMANWQNSQANAWRGPLGIGMQGREGYGQFHEFRIRPQRQQFNALSQGHQNLPSSMYEMNMGVQGQFPNVAMQASAASDNIAMEIRFAMAAEIQKQSMQSNMNSAMYQQSQMQAQNIQRPPIPQHPRAPTAPIPSQRGIPLASFANREMSNKTRPAQQYNSTRTGHTQNSIDNHRAKLPQQHNLQPRFQGHQQVRGPQQPVRGPQGPQYPQSMHSGLNRHQRPQMQSNQRPQLQSPPTARRIPPPKQPVATPSAQQSSSRSSNQQAPRPVQSSTTSSSRIPTTTSTTTQKSNKTATTSAPSTSSNSDMDSQSLAALVVESVLKGHDTNHVEQQIRLVNELMKGKPSTKSTESSGSTTEGSTSGSQGVSATHEKGVEPANNSRGTTPSSRRLSSNSDSTPRSHTTPPPRPASQTNSEQSGKKKSGRPQEMFVDLTDEEPAAASTTSVPKRKNPDIDIHVLIEIVNTKSQDLQFCILEKCLRNECQPKYLTRCRSSYNWWVYQSERKSTTTQDVTHVAKQIIHRSLHDKVYFREQMTAILQSPDLKRAKIFQVLCTEKVHVVGRAFQRPKSQAGLLFLHALKDFPASGTLSMYMSATSSNNFIQKVAKITEEEQARKKEPRVLVIEPIPDDSPIVHIEPVMQPSEPYIPPLSAEERYALENQQPIVIEPPPTPAPVQRFADEDDVAPAFIAPHVPSQKDQQQMSNTDLLNQMPLVIAPPPTPRAPSPNNEQTPLVIAPPLTPRAPSPNNEQTPLVIAPPPTPRAPSPNQGQRKSPPAPNHAHAAQPNSSKQQDCDVMQPPSQIQVPGRKQTPPIAQGPPIPGYVPYNMPQSILEVLNNGGPTHQPALWQYQAQLQFNIQNQVQAQQEQQRLQAHQQLLMHHQKATSPVQLTAMQRMLEMSQRGPVNSQPPVIANVSEQERPTGTQAILQGLVPKPTAFMGEVPLPIVLSKNPAVPEKSASEQHVPAVMSLTPAVDKSSSLPVQPEADPRPTSNPPDASNPQDVSNAPDASNPPDATNTQDLTLDQTPTHPNASPAANIVTKQASEKNSQTRGQQEKLDALGDGSGGDGEFISLEDFITMSTDNGREVCASVSSSIDGDKKEADTHCNDQPKTPLPENELPETEKETQREILRDPMVKPTLRIPMKRIEDIYGSLGLKRLSKTRYRIKPTSSLMKPKRATVRRKFAVDDGIPMEDSDNDNDPAWEGIPSSHNSSTDEYSQDEETEEEEEEEKYKKICIRIKRPLSASSDEDDVRNCDFYDSSSESPRKVLESNKPPRRRKKRRSLQIDSVTKIGKSPGKEMSSDTCGESPVKVKRRKRRIIDSDDDSPFKKADPFFPPSPVQNKSAQGSPSQPSSQMDKSEGNSPSGSETDAKSTSVVTRDFEALRQICPSLQPSVQVARLTPGEIHNRKRKYRSAKRKKKRNTKEPSKPDGKQQAKHQNTSKKSKSSCPDSGSDTEPCETESVDNTQQADSVSGIPPVKDLAKPPVAYDLEFFTNEELFEELQRRQDLISCICGMTFVDRKHYNLHRDLHDKVNPKKCAICCEVFHDWVEFTSHTYSTHNTT